MKGTIYQAKWAGSEQNHLEAIKIVHPRYRGTKAERPAQNISVRLLNKQQLH